MSSPPLLSLTIFAPWAGALILFLLRRLLPAGAARGLALVASLSTLAAAGLLLLDFEPGVTAMQFVERHSWISGLNVHYHLGLDGLSLVLVLLTGIVSPVALAFSRRSEGADAAHDALFLLLQGSALGVFLALDFFPWFIFWELSLVPAFFLIRCWGGGGAARAAYQFVIYTLAGSAFLLLGFVAIYSASGTFDFVELGVSAREGTLAVQLELIGGGWAQLVFAGVLLGFAVKVPLFPFHTWLPTAYAEAPTGTSMFLTGVMSKMGLYGFLRILWPLFRDDLHAFATPLLWLAVAGVVVGAYAALKQTDIKRMLAYSSLNHLSYCLVALFAVAGPLAGSDAADATASLGGIILQMFNHGISAAALFACAGILAHRANGRREFGDFGGVRASAPVFAGLCGIALFSSLGLPGLNGFVGEFLIFRGVFGLTPWAAAVSTLGLLATALFLLTFWQRVYHGPAAAAGVNFRDVSTAEIAGLLPLALLMFVLGIVPQCLIALFNPLVAAWTATLP